MAETDTAAQTPKGKPRPIVRLGIFLISHSLLVSVVCCIAGVVALLLLPVLAKNTYVSENALMPGSSNPTFSAADVTGANKLAKDIIGLNLTHAEAGIEIPRLIAQRMADLEVEVYYHKFHPQLNQFHPLQFFSGSRNLKPILGNSSCGSYGINSVGIIRAPRGDGKESIVLVTPYNSMKTDPNDILSLGLAYSIFSLLSQVTWLAKDIIWLAADSRYGEYASVDAWLRDYHTPAFDSFEEPNSEFCIEGKITEGRISDVFRRAGTMAAALVFKVVNKHEETEKDTLSIYAEASNGQMPNLDLINIVNYLAVHRQGLRVKVEKFYSLLDSQWLKMVGAIFESLGKVARSVNPQWKFGIPVAEYVEGASTLASSIFYQALGVPTGSHGAFRDYQVDSVTLEISPKFSLNNEVRRSEFLLRGGRLIEGVIRSVNNLLEKFHQSFFLYLLTSSGKFVSVGVYMIPFALLLAPLPIVAAALYSGANKFSSSITSDNNNLYLVSTDERSTTGSWKWLHSAKMVFGVHLWGVIVSLLPYLICQLHDKNPMTSMFIWLLLSLSSLLVLYWVFGSPYSHGSTPQSHKNDWAILKSVMITAVGIGLGLMSIINFAVAQIGAILLVPICLMAYPIKLVGEAGRLKAITLAVCNLVLLFIGFPPTSLFVLKGATQGFSSVNFGNFWNWMESLWEWNSATYLYIGLVHLPCWVLCMHILLHPC